MTILLIDANVYLRFYDSSQPEYKKLLKTVVEIKDHILITQQIVNEVNRNKLAVFERSCNDTLADSALKGRHLPEHFDNAANNAITEWNKKRKDLQAESKKLVQEQDHIFGSILSQISDSADEVSKTLAPLFSKAKEADEDDLKFARLRKERGDPPGKPGDPLGDQLTWEQFLKGISSATDIWIISTDYDYLTVYKNQAYLNPSLHSDILKKAKAKPNIHCFNRLSNALQHFNTKLDEKLKSLPKEEELKEISKLELLPSLTGSQWASGSLSAFPTYSGIQNPQVRFVGIGRCPFCHSAGTVIGPITSPVGTGALAYQYICNECGRNWDVVEPNE